MAKQNNSVQTLRGFAILLVVMAHVIGYKGNEGMKVADTSFWRHLYFSLEYFRLPLFTVISGWVYTLRPLTRESVLIFLKGKTRRLLMPLVAVGLVYFITRLVIPGTNRVVHLSDIWEIFVYKYDLYWYLPSLFWVFITISFLEYNNLMKSFKSWLFVLILSIIMLSLRNEYLTEIPNYLGIISLFYLFPFFIIGLGIGRFHNFFTNRIFIAVVSLLFVSGITIQQLDWFNVIELPFHGKAGPLGLLVGITGTIVLFRLNFLIQWLIYIGGFSYTIYLFHVFGTAGSRIILNKLGVYNQLIVFLVSLAAGIIVPIIIELIIDRFKLTRFLFLGRRYDLPRDNAKK